MDLAGIIIRIRTTFMRGFFHLLYHQLAWSYDRVASLVSLGMWQDWISAVLPYIQDPVVLELGSGPGHIQLALKQKGIRAVGLDASSQMARMAASRVRKSNQVSELVIGYAQLMPFAKDTFKQVLATFPSDYIFKSATVQEIQRVLIPSGECLILPAAWITASSLKFRWAARLFEITGQVPDHQPDWLGPFVQAGFTAETIPIELPSSRLILIRARKAA